MAHEFLTLEQITEEIPSIAKATLYNAIANKELAATKIGRAYLVRRVNLDAWIDRKTVNPEAAAKAGGAA